MSSCLDYHEESKNKWMKQVDIYVHILTPGECFSPLTQGPCQRGEWLIMEKGGEEGVCRQTPCESPIRVRSQSWIQSQENKLCPISFWRTESASSVWTWPSGGCCAVPPSGHGTQSTVTGTARWDKSWMTFRRQYIISEDLSLPAIWPDFWQDNTPGPSLGRLQANLKCSQNFKLTFNKIYTEQYKF